MEREEEEALEAGGIQVGSMVGRRRILRTWAVGEAWDIFSQERAEVIRKAF